MKFPIKISLSTYALYSLFFSTILLVSVIPLLLSFMSERNYLILMIFLRTILVFSALLIPALIAIKQLTKQAITKKRVGILGAAILTSILSVAMLSEALIMGRKALALAQERNTLWCELLLSSSSSNTNWGASLVRLEQVIEQENSLGKSFENKWYLSLIMPVVRLCTRGSLFQKNHTSQQTQKGRYKLIDSEDREQNWVLEE